MKDRCEERGHQRDARVSFVSVARGFSSLQEELLKIRVARGRQGGRREKRKKRNQG